MNTDIRFIAIDFETAYHSQEECEVCSVGIAVVENGAIVEKYYYLIRPKYDFICESDQKVHKIKIKDVIEAPTFPEIWRKIEHFFENTTIVFHNKGAELIYLSKLLTNYNLYIPSFKYIDSQKMFGCRLPEVCKDYGIEIKNHHNALEDAVCCAKCCIKRFQYYDNITELIEKHGGEFTPKFAKNKYHDSLINKERPKLSDYIDLSKSISTNIFANQSIYLSGIFFCEDEKGEKNECLKSKLFKAEIAHYITSFGGKVCKKVNENTTFVVLGKRSIRYEGKSKNHLEAERLNIRCITLDSFLEELNSLYNRNK